MSSDDDEFANRMRRRRGEVFVELKIDDRVFRAEYMGEFIRAEEQPEPEPEPKSSIPIRTESVKSTMRTIRYSENIRMFKPKK